MLHTSASVLAIAGCAAGLSAQVSLTHLGTVDVAVTSNANNPEFIGSNPSAVAWDGTSLWVAGFNNSPQVADTAIIKIDSPLGTPVFNTTFGVVSTPIQRGYSGLDLEGGALAAAWDSGAPAPEGITMWDLAGNLTWMKDGRGSSSVAFDPGFFGVVDLGTAWLTFGSGRRLLQDTASGADLYDPTNGMIVIVGTNTLWRDVDFDASNGDIYLRRQNELIKCERTGGNAVANNQILVAPPLAPFVNQQNLELVAQGSEQVIFFNDRNTAATGQPFEVVMQCARTDGTMLDIDYNGFTAPPASGAYDFSYHAPSGTLAISDFGNRAVYLFSVSLFPAYGATCPGQGGIAPELEATGNTQAGGTITYTASNVAPSSVGAFVFGFAEASTPLTLPPACLQQVTPIVFSAGLYFTGAGGAGSGTGSFALTVSPGLTGIQLTTQSAILEGGTLASVITTNGVKTVLQ